MIGRRHQRQRVSVPAANVAAWVVGPTCRNWVPIVKLGFWEGREGGAFPLALAGYRS